MKYWIIVNGTQLGPMDLAQLINTPRFGPESPVWREGLADWTTASRLQETAVLFRRPQPYQQPGQQAYGMPQPAPYRTYAPGEPMPGERPAMPPTYLVWAILATLCCCLPGGIVALVYSSRVSPLYNSGDYEGARRASERAGLWVIISFVAGIIWAPFYIIWSLLTA